MTATRKALAHHNTYTVWAMLFLGLALFAPTVLMPITWINLKSVDVSSGPISSIVVQADRVIHNNFEGSFNVTVNRANDHSFICNSPYVPPFIYRAAASSKNPVQMSISKWFGNNGDFAACLLGASGEKIEPNTQYYLTTCHYKFLFGLRFAKRCVVSNTFTVAGKLGD